MARHLESSRHHIRKSASLFLFRAVVTIFVIDSLYTLLLAFFFGTSSTTQTVIDTASLPDLLPTLWIAHTVQFFITIVLVGSIILRWCRFTYYITDHELIIHSGVVKVDEVIYELSDLHTVKIYQSWAGRLLNYGNVKITIDHFGHHEEIHLNGITDPKKYERIFREQTEKKSLPD